MPANPSVAGKKFDCWLCGDSLRRGNWANVGHALAHFGIKNSGPEGRGRDGRGTRRLTSLAEKILVGE